MKVKHIEDPGLVRIIDLKTSDLFVYCKELYMKTHARYIEGELAVNAVSLEDGRYAIFREAEKVLKVELIKDLEYQPCPQP